MALARTNLTLPEDLLRKVDEIAGPRGRSKYVAEAVAKQVKRDLQRKAFESTAGALRESSSWGRTPDETDAILRRLREEWDERVRRLWGEDPKA